mgnify:CR=1 FL=1
MATKVFRFKTIEKAEKYKWKKILEESLPYWEYDRYEYARLNVKFRSGIYRFRTLKEKNEWEMQEVCERWREQS